MGLRWLGRLLRNVRAGEKHSLVNHRGMAGVPGGITVSSQWFGNGEPMPLRCGGEGIGENISPPLSWTGVPAATVELAIVIEDPDAPLPRPVIHMIAYHIRPDGLGLAAGALNPGAAGLLFGKGTRGGQGYTGPRPPAGHGPHHYAFHVLALNRPANFQAPPRLEEFLTGITGSVIARGTLVGIFERQ